MIAAHYTVEPYEFASPDLENQAKPLAASLADRAAPLDNLRRAAL